MIKKLIHESIESHQKTTGLIDNYLIEKVKSSSSLIIEALRNSKKVMWCGNGGSAAQANHLSAELVGGMYTKKIEPFASICLNSDTAFITAWSNDDSFENVFLRQLQSLGCKGDVLLALSTSGNSKNIINAARYALDNGIKVISLTGDSGGVIKEFSDININVPSNDTQRIQEIHILIGHIICDIIENKS